jgi:hypothetical protein
MKKNLSMKYKRIKKIPLSGNFERNLILIKKYSKKMIDILDEKLVIFNFDETWLS